jgi:hypothetical protein
MRTAPYIAVVTREDGYWLADVDEVHGCTFARTLPKLREYVADVIALAEECDRIDAGEPDPHVDRNSVQFEFKYKLPAKVRRLIARTGRERTRARATAEAAVEVSRETVVELTALEFSQRDIAEILELSPARVGQLARARSTP